MRTKLEDRLRMWGEVFVHRPVLVIVILLAVSAVPISQIPHIEISTNVESLFAEDDPTLVTYDAFRRDFGRDGLVFLGIETSNIYDLDFVARLRALHEAVENDVPRVRKVTSMVNARFTRGIDDALDVGGLMDDFPTDAEALLQVRETALSNPLFENLLFSQDLRHTLIAIELEDAASDLDWKDGEGAWLEDESIAIEFLSGEEQEEVVNAISDLVAAHERPDFIIRAVGQPIVTTRVNAIMREDISLFLGITFLLAFAVLYALFRSVVAALAPILTIVLSILTTVGTMALMGDPLQVPTQILPAFLLCVGVCCGIHLLTVYNQALRRGFEPEAALVTAVEKAGPPLAMTSLTTAGALLSFTSSPLLPVSNLGLYAPLGVLLALVYSLSLLPAILALVARRTRHVPKPQRLRGTQRWLSKLALFSVDRPRTVLIMAAVLLVFAGFGISQTRFSYHTLGWLAETERTREDAAVFDRVLRGGQTLEILFDTGKQNGMMNPEVLTRLDEIHAFNQDLVRGPIFVGKTTSLVDILKETNRALNNNSMEHYVLPTDPQLIAQELLLFESSGNEDLYDFTDAGFRTGRMTLKIPWIDAVAYPPFVAWVQEDYQRRLGDLATVTVTGLSALESRGFIAMTESLGRSYVLALAVIAPMMILFLGSLRWGLASMIPNLVPIVLTLGLMGWLDIPLDIFTLLSGSIAIGLAVDDTIHVMLGFRRHYEQNLDVRKAVQATLETTGEAVFFTTVLLSGGFALFAFGQMTVVQHFGLLTSFALAAALIADVTLGPALMALFLTSKRETEGG